MRAYDPPGSDIRCSGFRYHPDTTMRRPQHCCVSQLPLTTPVNNSMRLAINALERQLVCPDAGRRGPAVGPSLRVGATGHLPSHSRRLTLRKRLPLRCHGRRQASLSARRGTAGEACTCASKSGELRCDRCITVCIEGDVASADVFLMIEECHSHWLLVTQHTVPVRW